jgi:hypothetical protein
MLVAIIIENLGPENFSKDPKTQKSLRDLKDHLKREKEENYGPESRVLITLGWWNYCRDLATLKSCADNQITCTGKRQFIVRRKILARLLQNGVTIHQEDPCPVRIKPNGTLYRDELEAFLGPNKVLELREIAANMGSGISDKPGFFLRTKDYLVNLFGRS